jgi:glycosyltransferase involved in cell wall biosynthesis
VDAITACSEYNAAEVRDRYGRDAAVVGNGVDIAAFRPAAPDNPVWQGAYEVAQRANPPLGAGDAPLLVWAGRLVRWKGTIDAVRALALMRTPVHLLIAGAGPEEGRLRDAARALGVAGRVHIGSYGYAQMPAVYAMADIVIGTSFANETFGMALAEASACERAVIATDFGGFRETVRHGETGLLVPPRDPVALATACDSLLRAPARRQTIGVAGRRFVVEHFAWPAVAARVRTVYRSALDRQTENAKDAKAQRTQRGNV